ncbi:hypothetical protein SAMN05428975_3099 [Mucilaginibacter sp. OK268]|jgi:hypothetical protein|uniref:hypothetical protein n=1 Tax=Mucilaginibacter sp. OK268 TaxID=1881048 RepID=UPI00088CE514|nr:hypothetical protein [Mucilaginibacter sp. OK268]SDP86114.1 hypothetical protein SAMN05428975_3099 [Mucilaginibacter sp. OK268]
MNKTIIAVYGRGAEGKSSTIKLAFQLLTTKYPHVKFDASLELSGDILTTIEFNGVKIGFESQGDPGSRVISGDTLRQLADSKFGDDIGNCDIIICATRTEGATVKKVDEIADAYDYHTLWISSLYSPSLDHQVLNEKAAANLMDIITSIMLGQL